MKVIGLFVVGVIALIECQNSRDSAINRVFNTSSSGNLWDDQFEEVTKPPPESLGAIEKCGQGADTGVHRCIVYNRCDGATRTILPDGAPENRIGFINIRANSEACDAVLDVCCGIPQTGVPSSSERPREPDVDPVPTQKPTQRPTPIPTQPPFTPPDIIPGGCGIRNENGIDFKLTGNTDNEAEYGEFPWMVAILKTNYNPKVDKVLAICGGSLIAPNVVLTGAHCVYKYRISDIKIRAGEWDTQTEKERLPYQERGVAQIIVHPGFKENILHNDYALLILDTPVQEAEHIKTICLPNPNEIVLSNDCVATGWGKESFGQESLFSVILKKIELPVVPVDRCQSLLRKTRLGQDFILDKSFMCAGGKQGKDTCLGDGGSPLACPDPQNPTRYVQVGIVAWGIGCGEKNIPGVYADVAKARSWIDSQLRKYNIDSSSYVN